MAKRGAGMTGKLRAYLKTREGQEVTTEDMAVAVDLGFGTKHRQKLTSAIGDMKRRGELAHVGTGVYRYIPQDRPPVSQIDKMWRTLRAERVVTIEYLQEIAGVEAAYAKDFMRALARLRIVAERAGKYALVKDTIARPDVLTEAAKKRIYEVRNGAIEAIDAAINELLRARMAVSDIGEDEG